MGKSQQSVVPEVVMGVFIGRNRIKPSDPIAAAVFNPAVNFPG